MVNNMKQAYNISTELLHILNNYNNGDDDLYHVVVQKGNVGSRYLYALQLLNEGNNIYVFRGDKSYRSNFDKNSPVLRLIRKKKMILHITQQVVILKLGNMRMLIKMNGLLAPNPMI